MRGILGENNAIQLDDDSEDGQRSRFWRRLTDTACTAL